MRPKHTAKFHLVPNRVTSAFGLLISILVLAGFIGIVAAFAGRERES